MLALILNPVCVILLQPLYLMILLSKRGSNLLQNEQTPYHRLVFELVVIVVLIVVIEVEVSNGSQASTVL